MSEEILDNPFGTFFTTHEVASILKTTTRTIQRYIKDGKIQAAPIGGRYKISAEQLKNFIDSRTGRKITKGKGSDKDRK